MIPLVAGELQPTLVEASAGTGKTYTITESYLRLVRQGLDVRNILVITFTNAATGELRDRIRNRLRDALREAGSEPRLRSALSSMDEAPISTIHSFCQQVLTERAFEIGGPFALELSPPGSGPLPRWAHERWIRACANASPLVQRAFETLTPTMLTSIAATSHAFSSLPLAPATFPSPRDTARAVDGHHAALRTAHAAAAADWRKGRRSIVAWIAGLPLLASGRNKIDGFEATLDEWLGAGDLADVEVPKFVPMLDPTFLPSVCLRRAAPPETHAFQGRLGAICASRFALFDAHGRLELALAHEIARDVRVEVPALERAGRHVSFDHLLHALGDALTGPDGPRLGEKMRERYHAAMVDEFQDTDRVQWEIVRRAFVEAKVPLVLVGDPKQSIYGFRGADVHAYLDAGRQAASRETLQTSYRSDPRLVEALNALFGGATDPFANPSIAYHAIAAKPGAVTRLQLEGDAAPGLHLSVLSEDGRMYASAELHRELPVLVANDIVAMLGHATIEGSPVRPRDIAVLVRANQKAGMIQSALRSAGVPAVLSTEDNVLETDEARELEQLLAAILRPSDVRRVRTAASTRLLGRDAAKLSSFSDDEHRALSTHLKEAQSTWRERGFHPAFRAILDREAVAVRMLGLPDGERRLTNLLQLGELLHELGRRESMGPEGLLEWLGAARHDPSLRERVGAEALQLRLESDADAVRIVTIHKSKGLEYPIVFLPYLWQGPDGRKDRLRKVPPRGGEPAHLRLRSFEGRLPGEADDEAHADAEELSERMRVSYVALTRARHHVRVYLPNVKTLGDSALDRLLTLGLPVPKKGDDYPTVLRARHEKLRARVRTLSGEAVSIGESTLPVTAVRRDDSGRAPGRIVRPVPLEIPFDPHRMGSFSHLVAKRAWAPSTVEEERELARDVEDQASEPLSPQTDEPRVTLADFPAGRVAGELLHKVFEQLDFARCGRDDVLAVADRELGRSRFSCALRDVIADAVFEVLEAPLGEGLRLRDVPRARCFAELEFLLPVGGCIGPKLLAAVLAEHAHTDVQTAFAKRAESLGFSAFHGWLKGFVDLVFEHQGRFYVVDWKSNKLGERASDYRPPALAEAMVHHDYVLQYLLYTVALHRHLRLRVPNYHYDTHFGGVRYLFLRGMPTAGVFADRPSLSLVEALSRLLDEGTA